jgi:two-component system response regulator YesN
MWNVIIVEDEIFVRESIRESISWESLGFQVIGEAGHGAEALELIIQHEPDMIVTDIVMPIMDGIELLRNARKSGCTCLFVMLSCLNEFEYVREAMELGASNYLLKSSMSVNSLKELLVKMDVLLLRQLQEQARLQDYYAALWGSIHGSPGLKLQECSQPTVLSGFHVIVMLMLHGDQPLSREQVYSFLDKDERCAIHVNEGTSYTTAFIWSHQELRIMDIEYGRVDGHIVVEYAFGTQMVQAWRRATSRMHTYWYKGHAGALEQQAELAMVNNSVETWSLEREIIACFEEMKLEACKKKISELWELMRNKNLSFLSVIETIDQLDRMLAKTAGMQVPYKPIPCGLHHDTAKDYFITRIETYFLQSEADTQMTEHPELNIIINYMKRNLDQEITLKALAALVAYEENYLGSLFKKYTGYTPIHFLHRLRVEQAKYYLRQTDLMVNEIGPRIGFGNDNHFIKIFKRWVGETPSTYRKNGIAPK